MYTLGGEAVDGKHERFEKTTPLSLGGDCLDRTIRSNEACCQTNVVQEGW